jgi:hypothetical protein
MKPTDATFRPGAPRGRLGRWGALILVALCGCPTAQSAYDRSPRAQKWFDRAEREFAAADIDAAHDSVRKALDMAPEDPELRLLAARVAIARLELTESLRLLQGLTGTEAHALRSRAYWYDGELEKAAAELDRLLDDPDVDDPWAKQISKLAHRGSGRKPFDIATTNGQLEVVEMAKVVNAPLYIVPIELDGEQALALVATGMSEVMIDSSTRAEPSWVSLRFGERFEVRDVPALTQDLTSFSMKLGAPIKALLGAHLLREINATLDLPGRQFVARAFSPPPPPVASRVDVWYVQGGGMVLGGSFGDESHTRLYVDSMMEYDLALDRSGWKKVGIDVSTLKPINGKNDGLKGGPVPLVQLGAFQLPQLAAVYGPVDYDARLKVDVDGAVGAGLLGNFRLTFTDAGRVLWVEQRPAVAPPPRMAPGAPAPAGPSLPGVIMPGDPSSPDAPGGMPMLPVPSRGGP